MGEVSVRPATADDGRLVAAILSEAFSSDPVSRWILHGRRDPVGDLRAMFGAMTREALRRPGHQVNLTTDASGAALWCGIDCWKMPLSTVIRLWPTALRHGFARGPSLRLKAATEKAHPRAPHCYLEVIGTRPQHQGKGTGSLLLRALLEHCDAEGVGAYLESSNPKNLAFYHRHGFRPGPAFTPPAGCPPLTPMWRVPGAGPSR